MRQAALASGHVSAEQFDAWVRVAKDRTVRTDQEVMGSAPDLMSLWTILDSTPEGRGVDWYPKLDDEPSKQSHL